MRPRICSVRIRELLEKIASYLLKKETITGQEMMAIIEGRDPALVDNYGANPNARPDISGSLAQPAANADGVEPPAKRIRMIDQPPAPPADPDSSDAAEDFGDSTSDFTSDDLPDNTQ